MNHFIVSLLPNELTFGSKAIESYFNDTVVLDNIRNYLKTESSINTITRELTESLDLVMRYEKDRYEKFKNNQHHRIEYLKNDIYRIHISHIPKFGGFRRVDCKASEIGKVIEDSVLEFYIRQQ